MRMNKPKLLLHICCAPDATVVFERLIPNYNLTGYFYNPNIHPREEYEKRLKEMQALASKLSLPLLVGKYDDHRWFNLTRGYENEEEGGKRCPICFTLRLRETARSAKEGGMDFFATVLTVSPHKDAALINTIGRSISEELSIPFLEADFKKKDGFKRSVELSQKFGLYRQNYCGCEYSRRK